MDKGKSAELKARNVPLKKGSNLDGYNSFIILNCEKASALIYFWQICVSTLHNLKNFDGENLFRSSIQTRLFVVVCFGFVSWGKGQ